MATTPALHRLQESIKQMKRSITDPISLDYLEEPTILSTCAHTFSKSSLQSILNTSGLYGAYGSGSGTSPCPICRKPFTLHDMKPNFILQNTMSATMLAIEQLEIQQERMLQEQHEQFERSLLEEHDRLLQEDLMQDDLIQEQKIDVDANQYTPSLQIMTHSSCTMINVISPDKNTHAQIDVVICIDNSGSMANSATRKGEDGKDINEGFTLLNMVQHAAKAFVQNLRNGDRVGIVTFSANAQIVLHMTKITNDSKQNILDKISSLQPDSSTNLWAGIESSMDLLRTESVNLHDSNHILLLTDGVPNNDPRNGYTNALNNYRDKYSTFKCSLNMVGFGYNLNSMLLNDCSQEMNGSYFFIPDATFVGTTFAHIGANMAVTAGRVIIKMLFEDEKDIDLVLKDPITDIDTCYKHIRCSPNELALNLGNICYGQNRSFCIPASAKLIAAQMIFTNTQTRSDVLESINLIDTPLVVADNNDDINAIKTQLFRQILTSSVRRGMNYAVCGELESARKCISNGANIVMQLLGVNAGTCTDIRKDMIGQIAEALSRQDYYDRWGRHYLHSLANAHISQQSNNFKDPGIQSLGGPLFQRTRDSIDELFNNLEPPRSSLVQQSVQTNVRPGSARVNAHSPPVRSMASYNSSSGPCFRGDSLVKMNDKSFKRIDQLMPGDKIDSYSGQYNNQCDDHEYKVRFVLKSVCANKKAIFVRFGMSDDNGIVHQTFITQNHPILIESLDEYGKIVNDWYRPIDLMGMNIANIKCDQLSTQNCDYVYNVILESGHIMNVGGINCVTLAHGFTGNFHIEHPFYGTNAIISSLVVSTGVDSGYVLLNVGAIVRDKNSSWVIGFDKTKVVIIE